MKIVLATLALLTSVAGLSPTHNKTIQVGDRPYWLISQMAPSSLKDDLMRCADEIDTFQISDWSIAHRGACLQYPEHTIDAYEAGIRQGSGIIECDVTFTADLQLICRHAQCDLHYTTNVVTIPELNEKCTVPFQSGTQPLCCATDFTMDEIKMMCAKMESEGPIDGTPEEYAYGGTALWRTEIYAYPGANCPKVVTHMESLKLIADHGLYYVPELKSPQVDMPFTSPDGTVYSQVDYRQALVDEYVSEGIPPEQVWLQSFNQDDVYWWLQNAGEYGIQSVMLDMVTSRPEDLMDDNEWIADLAANGVRYLAPAQQLLVQGDPDVELRIRASDFALSALDAGLELISWTLERSAPNLDGWYWSSVLNVDRVEGDRFNVLHVLNKELGVSGVFTDWPSTVTFYANCFNVLLRPKAGGGEEGTCKTIAEIVCDPERADTFGTLCSLVQVAELDGSLGNKDNTYTLFAPTNQAFANAPAISAAQLVNVLTFHGVAGEVMTSDMLRCKETIQMINGRDSRTTCDNNQSPSQFFQRGADNIATSLPEIIGADIQACNGVIHIVNNVMLPNGFF